MTFLQGLEAIEEHPLIGTGSIEAIAADDRCCFDIRLAFEHLGDLQARLLSLGERSTILKLEDAEAVALIFFRDEGGRQGTEGDHRQNDAGPKGSHDQLPPPDQSLEEIGVGLLNPGEDPVERVEDPGKVRTTEKPEHHTYDIGNWPE